MPWVLYRLYVSWIRDTYVLEGSTPRRFRLLSYRVRASSTRTWGIDRRECFEASDLAETWSGLCLAVESRLRSDSIPSLYYYGTPWAWSPAIRFRCFLGYSIRIRHPNTPVTDVLHTGSMGSPRTNFERWRQIWMTFCLLTCTFQCGASLTHDSPLRQIAISVELETWCTERLKTRYVLFVDWKEIGRWRLRTRKGQRLKTGVGIWRSSPWCYPDVSPQCATMCLRWW